VAHRILLIIFCAFHVRFQNLDETGSSRNCSILQVKVIAPNWQIPTLRTSQISALSELIPDRKKARCDEHGARSGACW